MSTRLVVSASHCESDWRTHGSCEACSYRIAGTINPHMQIGSADPVAAVRQHEAFVGTLRRFGARVATVPFVHAAYDSIFAKDSAILESRAGRRRAMLAHPRFDERRREQASRAKSLSLLGFDVHEAPTAPLEGGDVLILPDRSLALLGVGFRSSIRAAPALARFLGMPVLPLELKDPALYHLDMALSVLEDGTALYCEEAFTADALTALGRALNGAAIRVARADALRFACNLVELDDVVVAGAACPAVALALRAKGRNIVVSPLDEFHRAGGGAACLVAKVHDDGSVADSPTAASRSTAA